MRLFAVIALVGSALIAPALVSPAAAALACPADPAAGSTVGGSITVSGGTCTLDNVKVGGSITVLGGGQLVTLNGTSVTGGISSQPNSSLCLKKDTVVQGAISQTGGVDGFCFVGSGAFFVDRITAGSMTVNGATALVFICGSTIKGNLTVTNGNGAFVLAAGNDSQACRTSFRNTIGGKLTVTDNVSAGEFRQIGASKNDVAGAMVFSRNTSDDNVVDDNVVKGGLACADNDLPPTLGLNGVVNSAAGGKSGQCAGL